MTTTNTSSVDILIALDRYSNGEHSLGEANAKWKQCMFALTKANRSKTRGMVSLESHYSPEMVREELEATVSVRIEDDTPDLQEEEEVPTPQQALRKFVLVDAWEEQQKSKQNKEDSKENSSSAAKVNPSGDKATEGGLRQRKGNVNSAIPVAKNAKEERTDKWTTEEPQETLANPIDLFGGLPPQDLKVSQKRAKEALEGYIQAANHAATILRLLDQHKESATTK